jgi:hypothetical protein
MDPRNLLSTQLPLGYCPSSYPAARLSQTCTFDLELSHHFRPISFVVVPFPLQSTHTLPLTLLLASLHILLSLVHSNSHHHLSFPDQPPASCHWARHRTFPVPLQSPTNCLHNNNNNNQLLPSATLLSLSPPRIPSSSLSYCFCHPTKSHLFPALV